MQENCKSGDCPMANRIKTIEDDNKRAHKEFYEKFDRVNEHIVRTDERYNKLREDNTEIKESIKENTEAIKAIQEKPGKRWETLVGTIISAVIGIVIGVLAAKIGI